MLSVYSIVQQDRYLQIAKKKTAHELFHEQSAALKHEQLFQLR